MLTQRRLVVSDAHGLLLALPRSVIKETFYGLANLPDAKTSSVDAHIIAVGN